MPEKEKIYHVNFRQKPAGTAASEKLRLLCTCLSASIAVNLRLLADFLSVSQPSNSSSSSPPSTCSVHPSFLACKVSTVLVHGALRCPVSARFGHRIWEIRRISVIFGRSLLFCPYQAPPSFVGTPYAPHSHTKQKLRAEKRI